MEDEARLTSLFSASQSLWILLYTAIETFSLDGNVAIRPHKHLFIYIWIQ